MKRTNRDPENNEPRARQPANASVNVREYDTVVIGAGAAGMAAAGVVAGAGHKTAILDRENHAGGILHQCIHNGFGLHRFKQELTGPEYAELYFEKLAALPLDWYLETTAVDIRTGVPFTCVRAYSARYGVLELNTRTVILAMGCRERNRGNIGTSGARPSGVFTAGCAQRLLNIDGYLPGKNVVIIGSGDIGLIMARRLTWSGAKVLCVVEIQPYPSGLTRNIVQCLEDNAIPLYLNHAVVSIEGKDRVEAVSIAPLVSGVLATEKSFTRKCDTVLLSVGLIPENELSRRANVTLNPDTAGPVVDQTLQTSTAGIFACGNVLHVHDLVDFVSEEAERCGANVVKYLEKRVNRDAAAVPVVTGSHIKYVVPNACTPSDESRFYMRPLVSRDTAELTLRQAETVIWSKKLRHVRPAEMISVTVSKEDAGKIVPDSPVAFSLQI